MALTKDDLQAVRSIVREETKDFVTKDDVAKFATKDDLVKLVTKDDLAGTERRLTKKIEAEAENLAQITIREFGRVHRRTEALARHVGYTFEPERDEGP
jgi:hypothetical protein